MAVHVVNVNDRPDVEDEIDRSRTPGAPRGRKTTRFLGPDDGNFVHPTRPPYAYFIERPAGVDERVRRRIVGDDAVELYGMHLD